MCEQKPFPVGDPDPEIRGGGGGGEGSQKHFLPALRASVWSMDPPLLSSMVFAPTKKPSGMVLT